ncbi:MAG TPA: C39 family peptidase [Anaerolineales bacterium]|nr:C39 family peptidase [Anaerolineales bacterium]
MSKPVRIGMLVAAALLILASLGWLVPGVRTRVEIWTAELAYRINPPDEIVFVPAESQRLVDLYVTATLQAHFATATPTPVPVTPSPTLPGPSLTPTETPLPTNTPTPLPEAAGIEGVEFQTQRGLWNYCGPSTLAMAISFWGDKVLREEVGTVLRGGTPQERTDDKNVMPYEKENYILQHTGLRIYVRSGGNIELLKALVAAGYPVVIEKHDTLQDIGWVGHYLMITGFDDAAGEFISMDTYHGEDSHYSYEEIEVAWRAFNYLFYVVYPPSQEAIVSAILGPYVDFDWATQHALDLANSETQTQTGVDLFFAWFNVGTSYVNQFDYGPASTAFDTAFAVYAGLEPSERPWRMMWYQTGPYFAYFYSGRYFDVITLADQTLDGMTRPILEESFYWRGLAKEAIGDIPGAIADLAESVTLNPNFAPGWAQLARLQP